MKTLHGFIKREAASTGQLKNDENLYTSPERVKKTAEIEHVWPDAARPEQTDSEGSRDEQND